MPYRVQSLERGIDILAALRRGPHTVTEVAAATGLAKGTAFRLLASLGYRRLVIREPGGSRYMLGPGLLGLLDDVRGTFGWIDAVAGDELRRLWEEVGETVIVHVRLGFERVCVSEHPSAQAIRYTAEVGAAEPLHVGSAGRVLLAFMDEDDLERLLPRLPLEGGTAEAIHTLTELRREIARTRERGWATSAGERVPGSGSLSVPLRLPEVAALSVLGPADRFGPERQEAVLPTVQRAAAEIERATTLPVSPRM